MYYNKEEEQFLNIGLLLTILACIVSLLYLKAYIFVLALTLFFGFYKIVACSKQYKYIGETINDFF